jgi:hypothetical protein
VKAAIDYRDPAAIVRAYREHGRSISAVCKALGLSYPYFGERLRWARCRLGLSIADIKGDTPLPAPKVVIEESSIREASPPRAAGAPKAASDDAKTTPKQHACKRADWLQESLYAMITRSRWPVINPECVVIESRVTEKYNKRTETYEEHELALRTYVSDDMRAAPILDCKGRRFFFGRAQNQTPVDQGLWTNLLAYAEWMGADVVIGPDTYETAWWHEANEFSRRYAPEVEDYLCFGRLEIGDDFIFLGDMNVMTTAARPVTDLTAQSKGKWCVVPHSKMQLESVPSLDPDKPARQIMTTGSVTTPKVIPRKAGVKSIFDHIMGFLVVEIDDEGVVHCRQVNAEDDGSFFDLDHRVENGVVTTTSDSVRGIVFGDVHRAKLDRSNEEDVIASFGFDPKSNMWGDESLVTHLHPKDVYFHDLHDAGPDNHHNWDDIGMAVELAARRMHTVEDEIRADGEFLRTFREFHPEPAIKVVESNHDIMLDRWIKEARYRDGFNVLFGLHLEKAQLTWRTQVAKALDARETPPKFSLLEYAIREFQPDLADIEWLYDGDSHVVLDVELGHHGFRGANGARSSTVGYSRMGRKIMTGDPHSPAILGGTYRVGCMGRKHGYNKGPSGWSVTHGILYENGKRALVTIQHGRYCLKGYGRPIYGVGERLKEAA